MTYAQYCRLRLTVAASNRQVIRAAYRLLNPHAKQRPARAPRHNWLRMMLREHANARALLSECKLTKGKKQ